MILKWYLKTTNGYVRYRSMEIDSVIKVDDYVIKDESYPAIAVTDKKMSTEILQFNRFADRNIVFLKVQQGMKDNRPEMYINYLDMYPSSISDDNAVYELQKHHANIREVPALIKGLNVPSIHLLDAIRIINPQTAKNFMDGKIFHAKSLVLADKYQHVESPLHFISSVWTLCLPIPKKYHKIHINANQYFDYVCSDS
jgi:hypothetical protein